MPFQSSSGPVGPSPEFLAFLFAWLAYLSAGASHTNP